jgi:hypothetical protein
VCADHQHARRDSGVRHFPGERRQVLPLLSMSGDWSEDRGEKEECGEAGDARQVGG